MNKKLTDYVIDLVEILNKQQKQVFWGIFDILSMVVSIIVSYILFYGLINPAPVDYIIYTSLAFLFYQFMIAFWGLNASISRYSKITDFMKIFFGVTASSVLSYSICYAFLPLFSIRFIILFILLSTFLILLPRITWQLIYSRRKKGSGDGEHRRTFLIGAGDGGALFMDSYQHPTSDLELVGILDKDAKKKGQKLGGIPVLGSYDNLPELAKRHQIERVIVAIPSLDPSEYERILQMCNKLDVKCYKMPNVETVVQGLHQAGTGFQKIDIIDLLGRQEIRLDESRLGAELTGKTILVTGAGGSIGSEICRNHNHLRYFSFINSLSNIVSSTDIVFEGFFWIALHHRNMLVSSRMINNSWLVLLKDLQQTVIVLNVCDNWHIINPLELTNQLMINKVD